MRVVVVEDDDILLKLISMVFRSRGHSVEAVATTTIVALIVLLFHVRATRKVRRLDANTLAQRFHTLFEAATETPEHPVIPWEGASARHRALLQRVCAQISQEVE